MAEMKLCECGCGAEIPPANRYRRGHQSRTPGWLLAPPRLCGCGCGEDVPMRSGPSKTGAFRPGHWARVREVRPLAERFAEKTEPATDLSPNGMAGCVLWTADALPGGYGRFNVEGRVRLAHRVAYVLAGHDLPDALQLDHLCRRPACVNVEHLEPVTNAVNSQRGAMSRLTPTTVRAIRARLGTVPARVIAQEHNVSIWTIYNVSHGKTWRNVA